LATRGLQREDFEEVGQIIAATLLTADFARDARELSGRVGAIVERYPLYELLSA
jgi:glycine/serine hydroxymethyltransferase